ncbi:hypothetical protein F2Q70_00036023 [Brassica cretica]|uniref:Uncharacterized protein n=1 Tax=Brassica cretica TaxID=69181 RepID=A0A8S9JRT4_BRACR|nr:hypothetical protein F2Q70_00036023 [Brassica cretica]
MPRKNQLRLSFDGVWHERLVSIQACHLVVEFVIFVGKVEVEVDKERNSRCCFILLLAHQVFDQEFVIFVGKNAF